MKRTTSGFIYILAKVSDNVIFGKKKKNAFTSRTKVFLVTDLTLDSRCPASKMCEFKDFVFGLLLFHWVLYCWSYEPFRIKTMVSNSSYII